MTVAAIVPAAGQGLRLGPGRPKALRRLGGAPLLLHAVAGLAAARTIDLLVVAAPPQTVAEVRRLLADQVWRFPVAVVAGGETRQESVRRALATLPAEVEVVLVHDAARPLAPSDLADAVVGAVRAGADAAVPALPVVDTVKRVDHDDRVLETLDREVLRAVQTPQGFRRAVLARAHRNATGGATDDAGLVEALGGLVRVVPGHPEAFKVTNPLDFVVAEAVLAQREGSGRSRKSP